jgi:hypothetical protein
MTKRQNVPDAMSMSDIERTSLKRWAAIFMRNADALHWNMDATRKASDAFGVMSGTHTGYSDDDFAARMEEAEAIGHAKGLEEGFNDAMDQVINRIIEVAEHDDSSLIDPDKLIGFLGDLKPLVKGQDDGA